MRSRSPSRRDFLLVGVTGGIWSGKSTVCALFAECGRTVISADLIARDITEHDTEVRGRIKEVFGDAIYDGDGPLKRQELASRVFGHPVLLRRLNTIVHPAVLDRLESMVQEMSPEERRPYVVIEAALIYESGMDRQLDIVVVVDAPEKERIARVALRDGVPPKNVILRMKSQMSASEKVRRADFVIGNAGIPDNLAEKVCFLDRLLSAI